jgi:hypothetical protein
MRDKGLYVEEFEEVVSYLLSVGVINREENQKEKELYDKFLRMEDVAKDYLALVGIKTVHDENLQSIRLYAPSSETPEDFDSNIGENKNSNMSMSLNKEATAYLITLALYYEQKLKEEKITDSNMEVEISSEEFGISLASFLGYTQSSSKTIQKEAFDTLKRLRAVKFSKELFENEDNPLIIRPHILNLLPKDLLHSYLEELKGDNDEI